MSAMDTFNKFQRLRKELSSYRWSAELPPVRLFYDSPERTTEATITEEIKNVLKEASKVCEHDNGSDISYASSYFLGNAVKQMVMRYLDKKILKAAKEAKQEAELCLLMLKERTE